MREHICRHTIHRRDLVLIMLLTWKTFESEQSSHRLSPQPYLKRAKIGAKQKEGRALVPLSALPQFWPPERYAWTLGTYAYKYAYVYTWLHESSTRHVGRVSWNKFLRLLRAHDIYYQQDLSTMMFVFTVFTVIAMQ